MEPEMDATTGLQLPPQRPRVVLCPMFLSARREQYNSYHMFYIFADPKADYMIGAPP